MAEAVEASTRPVATHAATRSLPFIEQPVRSSGGLRFFKAVLIVLAFLAPAAAVAGAYYLQLHWLILPGVVVTIVIAVIEPLMDNSARVRNARAAEGIVWARERYGLQLGEAEAVALFFSPRDRHDRQPNAVELNGTHRYGVTSTDRYQDGIQLLHNAEHGYHIVSLASAKEIRPH